MCTSTWRGNWLQGKWPDLALMLLFSSQSESKSAIVVFCLNSDTIRIVMKVLKWNEYVFGVDYSIGSLGFRFFASVFS